MLKRKVLYGGACALALLLAAGAASAATSFVSPLVAYACASHTWANSLANTTGATTCTQPVVGDITAVAAGTVLGNATGSSAAPTATAAPVLGVASTTAGTLGLYSSASANAVTIQNLGATSAYNFNLPLTVGTAGQVLTSQAGTTNAMTWSNVVTAAFTVLSKTTAYTVGSAGVDDWKRLDNSGASTGIIFTLPLQANLSAGDNWCFLALNVTTNPFEILANTGETITMGNTTGTAAGNLQTSSLGSSVCIYMESTTAAYVYASEGAWSLT